jgi:2-octaprenyl-3-methyl-6-methoxy-1,4-benzoquinol hydroxylase
VVGAACALALQQQGLEIALVEMQEPAPWFDLQPDLRVYALAPDNADLLQSLRVWREVCESRVQPYRRMRIWDAAGGDELVFDADTFGVAQLGWIVENSLLVDRLWAALQAQGIRICCPAKVETLEQFDDSVRLRLNDGTRLDASLAIAADGADSTLRELAGMEVSRHAYHQRGVVAFVETEHPHETTAWQRFLPTGPLAFLPFSSGHCSIVWTLPDTEAERVLALEEAAFGCELTDAFGGRLGQVRLASSRVAFPLRRQLIDRYVSGRVLAIGDAAHAVHPLAGQGVNLGLRDVAALCELVRVVHTQRSDWAAPHRLQRWARMRRSDNTVSAYGFDIINRIFSNDEMPLVLTRGPLLGLANKLSPLKRMFWRRAAGI